MNTRILSRFRMLCIILVVSLLGACAAPVQQDYSAFKQSNPASILVLPPLNESPEVDAPHSMLSHAVLPLAESGYYVYPVTLVTETFRQNGLSHAGEIHQLNPEKLYEIFGADTALYLNITNYGTKYLLFMSETRVTVEGRLIDLKTGQQLWSGSATASSDETSGGNNNGLLGALIKQIVETLVDESYAVTGIASHRLLSAGRPNGILYGPRSPKYKEDGTPR
jgi:hypothetical protein